MFKIIYILIQFIICQHFCFAQVINNPIPRDTTYTIYSATRKVLMQYPKAKLVKSSRADNVIEKFNIAYVTRGERQLKVDLFIPNNVKQKLPLVIFIHGGGWVSGDRSMMIPMANEISSSGYITAVLEYRLAPEAKYPAAVHDIKAAVRWFRANAKKYYVDTNRIALIGCSAGGQLAALVGATNSMQQLEDTTIFLNHSSVVNAVIDIDGVLDFTDPAESGKDVDPEKPSVGKRWLGFSFEENPNIWIEASPLSHVSKNSSPICFINSSIHRFHAGRDEMIEKLNNYNIHSEVYTIKDSPHSFWLFDTWYEETIENIHKFLENVF